MTEELTTTHFKRVDTPMNPLREEIRREFGRKKSISQILKNLKTFDLLLFSGKEPISFLIESSELLVQGNGSWSHVGVVLEGKYLPKYLSKEKLYVWESTVSIDVPDVITGRRKSGVQIRDLEEVITRYNGDIGVAKLTKDLDETKVQDTVDRIFKKHKDTSYVKNPIFLIAGLCCCLRCFRPKTGSGTGIFCSQFVGEIYKDMGLISSDLRTHDIVPVDFLGGDLDGMEVVVDTNIISLKM